MSDRHLIEFHMVHDPGSSTVALVMVMQDGDGLRFRYEGEGTYHRAGDAPQGVLSIQSVPVETHLSDTHRTYRPDYTAVTTSCTVGDLRPTKPLTKTLVEPDPDLGEGQKLIEEETEHG